MSTIQASAPLVTAIFRDGAHLFALSEGATLGDLAARVDLLGDSHEGAPIAVRVRLEPAAARSMARIPRTGH